MAEKRTYTVTKHDLRTGESGYISWWEGLEVDPDMTIRELMDQVYPPNGWDRTDSHLTLRVNRAVTEPRNPWSA